jgi:hypothetical protein
VDPSYILHPGYFITFEKSGSFFSKSMKQKLVATSSTHGSDFVNKRNKALGSCDTMDIDDSMRIVGENENEKERSEKQSFKGAY